MMAQKLPRKQDTIELRASIADRTQCEKLFPSSADTLWMDMVIGIKVKRFSANSKGIGATVSDKAV